MKKILLINPNNDFFSNPTLSFLLEELSTKNIDVSLVMKEQMMDLPEKFKHFKRLDFAAFNVNWPKKVWKWVPVLRAYFKLIQYCKKNQITTIVGIDPIGIVIAGRLKRFLKKTELHYLSFEIFFQDELKNDFTLQKIKQKEIENCKELDVLIIQDEIRLNLISKENKLNPKLKTFLIPVSPKQSDFSEAEKLKWRRFYREKLGIKESEKIILHSGSVAKWSGGELILSLLELTLPQDFKILIHSKFPLNPRNEIEKRLLEKQKEGFPLLFHENPFAAYEDYFQFLQCADFALALYELDESSPYTGKNLEYIGLSSGKFACYMSQNLPTMVTYSATFEQLNKAYNFGFVVKNSSEAKEKLVQFDFQKNKNSLKLYENELNPTVFAKKYLEYLTENK